MFVAFSWPAAVLHAAEARSRAPHRAPPEALRRLHSSSPSSGGVRGAPTMVRNPPSTVVACLRLFLIAVSGLFLCLRWFYTVVGALRQCQALSGFARKCLELPEGAQNRVKLPTQPRKRHGNNDQQ
eukprot:4273621-Alexandrium_andersonii.AAC.1